jgi:hypothetical protein
VLPSKGPWSIEDNLGRAIWGHLEDEQVLGFAGKGDPFNLSGLDLHMTPVWRNRIVSLRGGRKEAQPKVRRGTTAPPSPARAREVT